MEIKETPDIIAKRIVKDFFNNLNKNFDERVNKINFELARPGKSSNFDSVKSIIYISPEYKNDVNHYVHELFHAVSTKEVLGRTIIGLNKKYYKRQGEDLLSEISCGYGLNEGATHNYTINATKEKYGGITGVASYNFCANIYANLERYVGESVLKVIYANSSINEFIKTISRSCHTDEENIIKLIINTDGYMDTFRFFDLFLKMPDSIDVRCLLINSYTYLAKIVSDKLAAEGKEFNFFEHISTKNLSREDLRLFLEIGKEINLKNIHNSPLNTLKEYEKMALFLINEQRNGNLKNFDMVPPELKNGEFYNFLLLNCYLCDDNKIRSDIKTADIKSALTRKIFNPEKHAFIEDENLPQNIKTLLSTRYAVRANTATSDYYMTKCLGNKDFDFYLRHSDPDYFDALSESVKQDEFNK